MTSPNESAPPVVKLTQQELMSSHVDDLLNRQSSLRGESGVARAQRGWYYRNWFVFLVVGAIAAILAWGLLEPYFDDTFYVQGKIESVDTQTPMPRRIMDEDVSVELRCRGCGWIVIRNQKIWLVKGLRDLQTKKNVNIEELRPGREIGIYVRTASIGETSIAIGRFLVGAPPCPAPAKGLLSIERQAVRTHAAGMLLFPLVAGLVGLAIGAADGLICRLRRRALLGGLVGFLVGFIGGFVSAFLAGLIYAPVARMAMDWMDGGLSTVGFILQMAGRTLAWGMAGMAMGLGQGIVLRSKRLFLYGFIGGLIGGLFGGLLFDPVDLLLLGGDKPSAHWSRLIGFTVIGMCVGAMIGVVELLARDAWLRMVEGPLAGKEFLLFKESMRLGSSRRCDIYLFNDPLVSDHHATLRAIGDDSELENCSKAHPALVNGRPVGTVRLRHGDRITIGRTVFVFERRQG